MYSLRVTKAKAVTVREAQILGKPVVITRFPTSSSQLEEGVDGIIIQTMWKERLKDWHSSLPTNDNKKAIKAQLRIRH